MLELEELNDGSGRVVIHLEREGRLVCGKTGRHLRTEEKLGVTCPACLGGNKTEQIKEGPLKLADGRDIRPAIAHALLRVGKNAKCMEIGVQNGDNSKIILDVMQPSRMVCVDPWVNIDRKNISEQYFESNYETAKHKLMNYKVEFIRGFSQHVLPKMPADQFDFIYIDGDHFKEPCIQDIRNSLRLIRLYGIIGGHDYGLLPRIVQKIPGSGCVAAAIDAVFEGFFVDAMISDWWVIVTPEIKSLGIL